MNLPINADQRKFNTNTPAASSAPVSSNKTQVQSWRTWLRIHPAANLFPPMDEESLRALAGDIKKNGLWKRITITQDEKNPQLKKTVGADGKARKRSATTKKASDPEKPAKATSRPERWAAAVASARAALEDLREIQGEFESWRDGLPENLQSSALAEKLDAVCDLDIEGALNAVADAEMIELPLGFGRD
jgi:hypothetical protein